MKILQLPSCYHFIAVMHLYSLNAIRIQDELSVTRKSYEDQLSLMSDHLAGMNDKLSSQKDEIESLKQKVSFCSLHSY